jgi:hypothetical protein
MDGHAALLVVTPKIGHEDEIVACLHGPRAQTCGDFPHFPHFSWWFSLLFLVRNFCMKTEHRFSHNIKGNNIARPYPSTAGMVLMYMGYDRFGYDAVGHVFFIAYNFNSPTLNRSKTSFKSIRYQGM